MPQSNLLGLGKRTVKDCHDFMERLNWADEQSGEVQLDRFYRSHFPRVKAVMKVDAIELQRQGIDTDVELYGGKHIYFDEKLRAKDWGDFFLEEISVWKDYPEIVPPMYSGLELITIAKYAPIPEQYMPFLVPGWIIGKKKTDYITYVIVPTGKVMLLPFLLLQRAWTQCYCDWIRQFGRKPVRNETYMTTGICVPTKIVYEALFMVGEWGVKRTDF